MRQGAVENAVLLETQAFIDLVSGVEGVVDGGHARSVGGSGVSDDDRAPLFVLCDMGRPRGGLMPRTRSALAVLAAVTLAGCADSPRRSDKIVAPPALDASASRTLLQCPTSQSASAFGLLGLLGGVVSLGGNSVALPFGAVSLPTLIALRVPASTTSSRRDRERPPELPLSAECVDHHRLLRCPVEAPQAQPWPVAHRPETKGSSSPWRRGLPLRRDHVRDGAFIGVRYSPIGGRWVLE